MARRGIRAVPSGESAKKARKYTLLHLFLASVPGEQRQIALTFSEIARILGGSLPKSAYLYREWWGNNPEKRQSAAWVKTGWRVQEVFLKSEIVVFRRAGADPVREIPRLVRALLNGRAVHRLPHGSELSSWIGFSRRVGWYFEGVTLYEQNGACLEGLSEKQRAEVDEDYAVCKQGLKKDALMRTFIDKWESEK